MLKSLKITYINFPGQYLTCYKGSNMRVEILYVIPVIMHIVSMVKCQGGGLGAGTALLLNF